MFQDENKPSFLTVGTPQCAAFCGFMGVLLAVLLLTIGFWRTLMLAAFLLAGLFLGGVKDKQHFLQEKVSALFPGGEKKPYRAPAAYPAAAVKKKAAKAEPADGSEEEPESEDGAFPQEDPEEDPEEESEEEEPEEEEPEEEEPGEEEPEEEDPEEEPGEEEPEEEDPGEAEAPAGEDSPAAGEDEEDDGETAAWQAGPETRDGRLERAKAR